MCHISIKTKLKFIDNFYQLKNKNDCYAIRKWILINLQLEKICGTNKENLGTVKQSSSKNYILTFIPTYTVHKK